MRVDAADLEAGGIVVHGGELWRVIDVSVAAHGDGASRAAPRVQARLRRLEDGSTTTCRFRAGDRVETAVVETCDLQYLYRDGALHHFMDPRTFEQSAIEAGVLRDALAFLRESDVLVVEMVDGRPVGARLPGTVDLVVTGTGEVDGPVPDDSPPEAVGVLKDAMLETGLTIRVPLGVQMGERVRVDTRTGQFVERVTSRATDTTT